MRQNAYVIEDGEIAKIMIMRNSACTGDCRSCSACSEAKPLYASALNKIAAKRGQSVIVETETAIFLFYAFAVYTLPLIFFFTAYFGLERAGLSEPLQILLSLILAALSFVVIKILDKKKQKTTACTIVSVDAPEEIE